MQEFFNRIDSGAYDHGIMAVIAVTMMALILALMRFPRFLKPIAKRSVGNLRAERKFFEALGRARKRDRKCGPHCPDTRNAMCQAVGAWRQWQGRDTGTAREGERKPNDHHVIELMERIEPVTPNLQ